MFLLSVLPFALANELDDVFKSLPYASVDNQSGAFSGDCDADFFRGEILPGGVDTQFYLEGKPGVLSARYTLKGVDAHGTPTLIFIENRGENDENGVCVTHPRIFTDNPALIWLETAALTGRVTGGEGGVIIRFYTEE